MNCTLILGQFRSSFFYRFISDESNCSSDRAIRSRSFQGSRCLAGERKKVPHDVTPSPNIKLTHIGRSTALEFVFVLRIKFLRSPRRISTSGFTVVYSCGKEKLKTAPSFSFPSAHIRPLCLFIIRFTIASPTPVPSNSRSVCNR